MFNTLFLFHDFRMDLHTILHQKRGPYDRPPPIAIHMVASKDQTKVMSWDFMTSPPKPSSKRTNKIVAITDGKSVCKITVFQEFADQIKVGKDCVLRGYVLRGNTPPYFLTITKDTRFRRTT